MRLLALLGALILPVPASLAAHDGQADAPWDFIEFEVKSWGSPLNSWRIIPNGGGSWTEAVRPEGSPPTDPPSTAWHEIEPEAANYDALVAILENLPSTAPDYQDCTNFMTDAAYGTLRLTKGATTTEIAWNSGCRDDDYLAFLDVLKAADQHMKALGEAAPLTRTEPPPGN